MKKVLYLVAVLSAFGGLVSSVQAAEKKFIVNIDTCMRVHRSVALYDEAEAELTPRLKERKKICEDFDKNPTKYYEAKSSTAGKSLFEIMGYNIRP